MHVSDIAEQKHQNRTDQYGAAVAEIGAKERSKVRAVVGIFECIFPVQSMNPDRTQCKIKKPDNGIMEFRFRDQMIQRLKLDHPEKEGDKSGYNVADKLVRPFSVPNCASA